MTPTRVALIGMGRMGRAIDALAAERDCTVVARVASADAAHTDGTLSHADVAIEFTVPEAAFDNALRCLSHGVPVVIGTTGWYDQLPALEAAVRDHGGRALWSPNFSPGVQLMLALLESAGELFRDADGFDVHLVETHHSAKLDAPSGTAIAMSDRLSSSIKRPVPTTSVRTGSVPGTHDVIFDAPFEQVRLVHEARDRRVFADGALRAARWLARTEPPGLYTMRDVLRLAPLHSDSQAS